jgi:hypothetical protein
MPSRPTARATSAFSRCSPYGDYTDTVGLRNSHDKSFPIGIAFGSRVFVCDNLAFIGDHVIRRKHTVKAKRELPGLVTEIVQPLQAQRVAQNQKLLTYQGTPVNLAAVQRRDPDARRQGGGKARSYQAAAPGHR